MTVSLCRPPAPFAVGADNLAVVGNGRPPALPPGREHHRGPGPGDARDTPEYGQQVLKCVHVGHPHLDHERLVASDEPKPSISATARSPSATSSHSAESVR